MGGGLHFTTQNISFGAFLLLSHQITGPRTRSEKEVRLIVFFVFNSVDLHTDRRLFLCTESHIRFTPDLPSIRCGYSDLPGFACFLHGGATFVCSSQPTFIFCPVLFDEGGTAPSSILRYAADVNCVAPRAVHHTD